MALNTPWGLQAVEYHAREDRRMLDALPVKPGLRNYSDYQLSGVTGLTVRVAPGDALVQGSHAGVAEQGLYSVKSMSNTDVVATTAHGTHPRIDRVVLRVYDTSPAPGVGGDALNNAAIEIIPGTATAGANLTNLSGVGAEPASSLTLGYVLVPNGFTGPFVDPTHIRQVRPSNFSGYVEDRSLSSRHIVPYTQAIHGTNNAYQAQTNNVVIGHSGSGATNPMELGITPDVDMWWDLHAHIGLIQKTDAAYHYVQVHMRLKSTSAATPAVGSGAYGFPAYAASATVAHSIFTGHSTVMTFGNIDFARRIPVTAGLNYAVELLWTQNGGTWNVHQDGAVLWFEATGWARN